jgi:hypothetical protein
MSSLIAGTMCGTLDDMEFEQKLLYFESHNPFVPMFPTYLQISPYLQIYRSVSPDLQICIVTLQARVGVTSPQQVTVGVSTAAAAVFLP